MKVPLVLIMVLALAPLRADPPIVMAPVTVGAGDFTLSIAIDPATQRVSSATVSGVVPGSFAETVGLRKGDLLTWVSEKPITKYEAWEVAGKHAFLEQGTDLVFVGKRMGRVETQTISVTYQPVEGPKTTPRVIPIAEFVGFFDQPGNVTAAMAETRFGPPQRYAPLLVQETQKEVSRNHSWWYYPPVNGQFVGLQVDQGHVQAVVRFFKDPDGKPQDAPIGPFPR